MLAFVLALLLLDAIPGSLPVASPSPAAPGATSQAAAAQAAAAQAIAAPIAGPEAYRVHPGDLLAVIVYGDASLSQSVTVLPGGDIFYPLVGRIHVDNETPDDAARTISTSLKKYVRNPIVTVSVVSQGLIGVLVLGNVKNPGKYALPATARISDALAAAGGLAPLDGDLPPARISDYQGAVQQVSLQKLLHDGDTSVDMKLSNGSTVYIPAPTLFSVEVFGSVDHPGEIMLREGDHLAMAIARAGANANLNPDLNHVQVRRTAANGTSQSYQINLYDELKGGDISKDFPMQKGDIVYVPQARKGFFTSALTGGGATLLLLLKGLGGL